MTALEQSATDLYRTLLAEPERTGEREKSKPQRTGIWVEAVHSVAELEHLMPAWQALVARAAEPNVFYEPELLIPAIKAFGAEKDSLFLFVFHREHTAGTPVAIAFFPLERRRSFRRFPVRMLSAWTHPHAFLHTPILDAAFAREAWLALCDWTRSEPSPATLLEFPILSAEGPCQRGLVEGIHAASLLTYTAEIYTRAALQPCPRGGESYLAKALSHGKYKELRRQRRRLAEQGKLEVRALDRPDDLERWINYFLELEASGWKGEARSAILNDDASAAYFVAVCRNLSASKRLRILGLFLDDRPIALKCNFASGDGVFTIKIAFDQAYAKFSPGVLLELENVLDVHGQQGVCWMDSCAHPDHPMVNWLWTERRLIQHLLISPNSKRGNLLLALFGVARALKRSFTRKGLPHAQHPQH